MKLFFRVFLRILPPIMMLMYSGITMIPESLHNPGALAVSILVFAVSTGLLAGALTDL